MKKNRFVFNPSLTMGLLTLLLFYMMGLFYVTLFAWNYGSSFGPVAPGGRNYNLEPFLSIYRISMHSDSWVDPFRILVGNILLFVPFGYLFPFLVDSIRRIKTNVSILLTVFLSMLLSIFIEVSQFLFTYRVANVDDVILNTLGGFIGVFVYKISSRVIRIIK
ncbi:VanZ family protein [Salipaludibacillus sp. LMS25]|uniref:VanZ family protein n=1 Tax=Salipaludibacillus sp. LMS25 TaxID=2924031 RepID=UPI0020D18F44|nr:VanZ family protein [Salipaludibacillus sp. LMS25]UTR14955.1 VanZ family protein [Salipaludibacillus sp. LMS25]